MVLEMNCAHLISNNTAGYNESHYQTMYRLCMEIHSSLSYARVPSGTQNHKTNHTLLQQFNRKS